LLLWIALIALAGILAGCSCENTGGGQYRQIGEKMGQMKQEGTAPGSYMYVANMDTMLYWPNVPAYADAIPSDKRVYIKDTEALKQFKDYKPGPL
jgi:hypothetical protein